MIAGEDADRDSTARSDDNFTRTQRAIAERLRAAGFTVYDEADVVPDLPPARTVRPLFKMFEGVKLAKTPVDVIMVIQIWSSVRPDQPKRDGRPDQQKPGAFRPFVSVDASYWRVRDRQFLGNHRLARGGVDFPLIEVECAATTECRQQRGGDSAEQVGTAIGDEIATKLAAADLSGD